MLLVAHFYCLLGHQCTVSFMFGQACKVILRNELRIPFNLDIGSINRSQHLNTQLFDTPTLTHRTGESEQRWQCDVILVLVIVFVRMWECVFVCVSVSCNQWQYIFNLLAKKWNNYTFWACSPFTVTGAQLTKQRYSHTNC